MTHRNLLRAFLVVPVLVVASCTADRNPIVVDAGGVDSGAGDGAASDAARDAGPPMGDSGGMDVDAAGMIDAGGMDVDAGVAPTDAGVAPTDAGVAPTDAGVDAGVPATDAGFDAGRDAGPPATDAGFDAGFDAGRDAGTDAGFDAGFDAGTDAGFDAGTDAGTDAGFDAGRDAGLTCGVPGDCPGSDTACSSRTCIGGTCGVAFAADGTACGSGGFDTCGSGVCVVSTFTVLRVGDGAAALTSAATAGFLETRLAVDGSLVSTVNLPTGTGVASSCTLAGSSTAEGGLSRSVNGAYLTLGGYAAPAGTAAVAGTTSAAQNRVVCRVSAAGSVDTSTRFDTAFSGGNIRSATSTDGTVFWASGSNSGIQYIPFGTTTATQITTTPTNNRWVSIAGGQLYGSAQSGTYTNVFTVGSGLPTTGPQTTTSLPGMPTATASPYGYVFFDRSAAVAGVDTLYVADDRAVASGGGVQKWTFDGATWTLAATFDTLAGGARGVTGYVAGANVVILATAAAPTNANTVVRFLDTGAGTPTGTVISTAGTNTAFRGIALSAR